MEGVAVSLEIEIPPCVPGVHDKLLGLWVFHHLKEKKTWLRSDGCTQLRDEPPRHCPSSANGSGISINR
jgi:hypothetical protein